MTAGTPKLGTEKAYLDINELSARTGLSLATLHRLKDRGQIPYYQPSGKGGKLLFPPDAIERVSVARERSHSNPSEAGPRQHLSGRCPAWMQTIDTLEETPDRAT